MKDIYSAQFYKVWLVISLLFLVFVNQKVYSGYYEADQDEVPAFSLPKTIYGRLLTPLNSTASENGEIVQIELPEATFFINSYGEKVFVPGESVLFGKLTQVKQEAWMGKNAIIEAEFTHIRFPSGEKLAAEAYFIHEKKGISPTQKAPSIGALQGKQPAWKLPVQISSIGVGALASGVGGALLATGFVGAENFLGKGGKITMKGGIPIKLHLADVGTPVSERRFQEEQYLAEGSMSEGGVFVPQPPQIYPPEPQAIIEQPQDYVTGRILSPSMEPMYSGTMERQAYEYEYQDAPQAVSNYQRSGYAQSHVVPLNNNSPHYSLGYDRYYYPEMR